MNVEKLLEQVQSQIQSFHEHLKSQQFAKDLLEAYIPAISIEAILKENTNGKITALIKNAVDSGADEDHLLEFLLENADLKYGNMVYPEDAFFGMSIPDEEIEISVPKDLSDEDRKYLRAHMDAYWDGKSNTIRLEFPNSYWYLTIPVERMVSWVHKSNSPLMNASVDETQTVASFKWEQDVSSGCWLLMNNGDEIGLVIPSDLGFQVYASSLLDTYPTLEEAQDAVVASSKSIQWEHVDETSLSGTFKGEYYIADFGDGWSAIVHRKSNRWVWRLQQGGMIRNESPVSYTTAEDAQAAATSAHKSSSDWKRLAASALASLERQLGPDGFDAPDASGSSVYASYRNWNNPWMTTNPSVEDDDFAEFTAKGRIEVQNIVEKELERWGLKGCKVSVNADEKWWFSVEVYRPRATAKWVKIENKT